MKEITYNNQKKEIPDSPKEYYRYLELVLMMNAGEISPFQMRCKLLSCLLGMKHSLLLCRGEIQEELLAQLPALDGFFDITSQDGMTVYDARLKTGRNLLSAYKEWKGPGDMLSGITFGQFIECMGVMAEMERAREQGNEEGIGELISSIGRLLYKKQGPQEIGTPPFPVCFHAYIFFFAVCPFQPTGRTSTSRSCSRNPGGGMQGTIPAGWESRTTWPHRVFSVISDR